MPLLSADNWDSQMSQVSSREYARLLKLFISFLYQFCLEECLEGQASSAVFFMTSLLLHLKALIELVSC